MSSPTTRAGERRPLTYAQQGLWMIDQMSPGSTAYNMVAAFRLRGRVDNSVLRWAVDRLADRHDILLATVRGGPDGPALTVEPDRRIPLQHEDLAAEPDPVSRARSLIEALTLQPYDLESGSLFRLRLFRLAADDHVLAMFYHHIVCDGGSLPVLFSDLSELYRARLADEPDRLEPLALRYSDYVTWQREHLAGEATAQRLAWWRMRMQGAPGLIGLPTDRPRPAVLGAAGAQHHDLLPRFAWQTMAAAARAARCTPFMFLLASWAAFCSGITGETDLVIGTPTGNRFRPDADRLIGHFINYLPIRLDVSGNPSVGELVSRVRRSALEFMGRQDVPFEKLVEELRPERSLSHAPLVQVMFAVREEDPPGVRLPGIDVEVFRVDVNTAQWDLAVECAPVRDATRISYRYATDLFDASTIERMAAGYAELLATFQTDPDRPIGRLPLIGTDERHRLVADRGTGGAPLSGSRLVPVHEQIAAAARRVPRAPAIRCGGHQLTYRQLDSQADRLADLLAENGIGSSDVVGIHLPRGLDLIVAIVAVLKAGAAYLPTDLEWPVGRIRNILTTASACPVITTSDLAAALPPDIETLALDAIAFGGNGAAGSGVPAGSAGAHGSTEKARSRQPVGGDDLAYVIYTSGSTGEPKGVAVAHAGLANRLAWMQDRFELTGSDRVLHKTPTTFDVSVWELLWPLTTGACLVMAAPGRHRDPDHLVELIRSEQVSTLHFVPPMLEAFLDHPEVGSCTSLRRVICSGQELAGDLVGRFGDRLSARLDNLYGPTEASIDVTAWECRPAAMRSSDPVPIGGPAPGVRVCVLDPQLRLVPPGTRGELYLGGVQLARGYVGRPDLTADRFVPDPICGVPGARLYRTGDVVRWNSAGVLEYLGRTDHQIKLRGFRIEPGEIEAALREHPAIERAVIVAHRGTTGDDRLIAYLVGSEPDSKRPTDSDLREHLSRLLPVHLIPAGFVRLSELPVTGSGKLDRAALPDPDRAKAGHESAGPTAPRSGLERTIAEAWRAVLDLEDGTVLDIHRNFFELGGHSLLVTRLRTRLSQALVRPLSTVTFYQHPTIASLARALAESGGDDDTRSDLVDRSAREVDRAAIPASPPDRRASPDLRRARRRLAATPAGQPDRSARTWPLTHTLEEVRRTDLATGGTTYNHVGGLRLCGELDEAALTWAFERLGDRHEMLRTTFPLLEGTPRLWCDPDSTIPFTIADSSEVEAGRIAEELVREPFTLDTGPLMVVRLLRLSPRNHILFIRFHHIVCDGRSMRMLLQEVSELYAARVAGRNDPLEPLRWQFGRYALWERERLAAPEATAALGWWRDRLADAPPALRLPADRPRDGEISVAGAQCARTLDGVTWEGLAKAARGHRKSRFTLLFGTYAVLLRELTGIDDLVIGTPLGGRLHENSERIIGNFANSMPIRIDLAGDPTLADVLDRVRRIVLSYTYRRQVMAFSLEKALDRPLMQVEFTVSEIPGAVMTLPGVDITVVRVPEVTARNDLLLTAGLSGDGDPYGLFKYRTALFDRSTVEQWADTYARLVRLAVERPDTRLSRVGPTVG